MSEAADVLGVRRATLSDLINAKGALSPEMALRVIWKYRSPGRWRGGRPRIALETRQLFREMARANFLWGAPRIQGELLKLGIRVSQVTVSRYMSTSRKDRRSQAWLRSNSRPAS
jgi:hypothetical protein